MNKLDIAVNSVIEKINKSSVSTDLFETLKDGLCDYLKKIYGYRGKNLSRIAEIIKNPISIENKDYTIRMDDKEGKITMLDKNGNTYETVRRGENKKNNN